MCTVPITSTIALHAAKSNLSHHTAAVIVPMYLRHLSRARGAKATAFFGG